MPAVVNERHNHIVYVTGYEKRDHLGFFIKIEILA